MSSGYYTYTISRPEVHFLFWLATNPVFYHSSNSHWLILPSPVIPISKLPKLPDLWNEPFSTERGFSISFNFSLIELEKRQYKMQQNIKQNKRNNNNSHNNHSRWSMPLCAEWHQLRRSPLEAMELRRLPESHSLAHYHYTYSVLLGRREQSPLS